MQNKRGGTTLYTTKYNEGEGRDFSVDEEHNQNRMLAKEAGIDRIRKDEVARILLSFNRKNKLDVPLNDQEKKSSEGENREKKMTNLKLM